MSVATARVSFRPPTVFSISLAPPYQLEGQLDDARFELFTQSTKSKIAGCLLQRGVRPCQWTGSDGGFGQGAEHHQSTTKALPKHHQSTTVGFGRKVVQISLNETWYAPPNTVARPPRKNSPGNFLRLTVFKSPRVRASTGIFSLSFSASRGMQSGH